MDIKDCRIGMEVKANFHLGDYIVKGNSYKINDILGDTITFKGVKGQWYPDTFEPTNKFEVGDEVLYHEINNVNYGAKIWAVDKNGGDYMNRKYAIKYEDSAGDIINKVVSSKHLSLLKKKDELKPGDKFISRGLKYEILMKEYDKFYNKIVYFTKRLTGNYEGTIKAITSSEIDKIIYD